MLTAGEYANYLEKVQAVNGDVYKRQDKPDVFLRCFMWMG